MEQYIKNLLDNRLDDDGYLEYADTKVYLSIEDWEIIDLEIEFEPGTDDGWIELSGSIIQQYITDHLQPNYTNRDIGWTKWLQPL